MSKFKFYRRTFLSAALFAGFTLLSCVDSSNPAESDQRLGMVEIRARVVNPPLFKSLAGGANGAGIVAGIAATVADRIIIEVSGDDILPTRIESGRLDMSRPSVVDTIKNMPLGRNRRIVMWAVDRSGDIVTHIDSLESRTVNIEAGVVTPIFATFIPAAGSIYLNFLGLTTAVASVHAVFIAEDGTVVAESSVARAVRTFVSLDNIPHQTKGVLRVLIIGASGDTMYIANRDLTFNARGDQNIDLQFMPNVGMIGADITIYAPGVTTGSYNFNNQESVVVETGELIITEIMWNVSNDNYIEVYNPSEETVFFDTLTTDVDGTRSIFADVTIAGKGYLVIGRQAMPHIDLVTSTTGGLPISNTGNWITLRRGDGTVIDRVICSGSNTALGWPAVSGRRSIELDRDKYDVTANNYGKNWRITASTTPLEGMSSNTFGTPGR